MQREMSGTIGIIGGLVDLLTGASIFYQNSMAMGAMMNGSAILAYAIMGLGVTVFLTGVSLFTSKVMHHFIGLLMLIYGFIMLLLGAGMIAGFFNVMMQWSWLSGIVMITLGLVMLYSGLNMTRKVM